MPSKNDLAKIHIAKKELNLTDEVYRAILHEQFRKESAAQLTPMQVGRLLRHFQNLGWKPKRQRSLPGIEKASDPMSRKIRALWIELHKAGVVHNSSEQALLVFVQKMTKVARLQWCSAAQKAVVIEALKDWGKRKGVELV
jgi:phage gp16-like protein